MNLLITGANGFIGDYFVKKYESKYSISKFSFRADSLDNLNLSSIDAAQILTYMKLANIKIGLLINFNVNRLVNGIKRFKL